MASVEYVRPINHRDSGSYYCCLQPSGINLTLAEKEHIMKKLVAFALATAIASPALAGKLNQDYTACKALVKEQHPEYFKIKLKKVKSKTMELKVIVKGEPDKTVVCDRATLTLV